MPSATREQVEEHLRQLRPDQLAAVSQFITSLMSSPGGKNPVQSQALDHLYGALADNPMPEITSDPLPEQRNEIKRQRVPHWDLDMIVVEWLYNGAMRREVNEVLTERLQAAMQNAAQLPPEIQDEVAVQLENAITNALWDADLADPQNDAWLREWIEEARQEETVEFPTPRAAETSGEATNNS